MPRTVKNDYKSGEKRSNNLMAKIERHVDGPLPETHLSGKACDSDGEITRHKTFICPQTLQWAGGISNYKQETSYKSPGRTGVRNNFSPNYCFDV